MDAFCAHDARATLIDQSRQSEPNARNATPRRLDIHRGGVYLYGMPKKTPNTPARKRAGSNPRKRSIFDKRTAVAAILAPLVALSLLAFFAATKNTTPDAKKTPTPKTSTDGIPSPLPVTSPETASSCTTAPLGRVVESFDSATGWKVTAGKGVLAASIADKREGAASLEFDNSQNTSESVAEKSLGRVDLSKAKALQLWIHQNGNIQSQPWRVQLVSERGYYERTFPTLTVQGALGWCLDSSPLSRWQKSGSPSWQTVTAIRVFIPSYPGSGAGNKVSYDGFAFAS